MKVPFVDLKAQYLSIKPQLDAAIQEIIDTTAFIGGKPVSDFESSFAELYGVKHCISVANGTDSLYILMKMLGHRDRRATQIYTRSDDAHLSPVRIALENASTTLLNGEAERVLNG